MKKRKKYDKNNRRGSHDKGDMTRRSNIHQLEVQKEKRENGAKIIFEEFMMKDFSELIKDNCIFKEAQ